MNHSAHRSVVLPLLFSLIAVCGDGLTEERSKTAAFTNLDSFARAIEGVVWEAVGTFQVKRVQFSQGLLHALDFNNRTLTTFRDTTIMDPGIIKVEYHDGTSGWYAYADDLEVVLPSKIDRWLACAVVEGENDKKIPKDAWVPQGSFDADFIRIRESTVELLSENGVTKSIPAHDVTSAVMEFEMADGPWWVIEARDGSKVWLLKLRNSFGGLRCHGERVAIESASAPAFMEEREKRLWDFIQQLEKRTQSAEAFSLKSELGRRIAKRFGAESDQSKLVRKELGIDYKLDAPAGPHIITK